jgi:hypothetical protein
MREDDEFQALEAGLRRLTPVHDAMSRDRLMFRLGRESAARRRPPIASHLATAAAALLVGAFSGQFLRMNSASQTAGVSDVETKVVAEAPLKSSAAAGAATLVNRSESGGGSLNHWRAFNDSIDALGRRLTAENWESARVAPDGMEPSVQEAPLSARSQDRDRWLRSLAGDEG